MVQILLKDSVYHCKHCHKSYKYRGEVTGCFGADCCHGADQMLTSEEIWKEYKKRQKSFSKPYPKSNIKL